MLGAGLLIESVIMTIDAGPLAKCSCRVFHEQCRIYVYLQPASHFLAIGQQPLRQSWSMTRVLRGFSDPRIFVFQALMLTLVN